MICIKCGNGYSLKRWELGYLECLECASKKPSNVYTIAPAYNKGAYQLITQNNIKDIGK